MMHRRSLPLDSHVVAELLAYVHFHRPIQHLKMNIYNVQHQISSPYSEENIMYVHSFASAITQVLESVKHNSLIALESILIRIWKGTQMTWKLRTRAF